MTKNSYNYMLRSILRNIGQMQVFFKNDEEKNTHFEKDIQFYKTLLNYKKDNIEIQIVNNKKTIELFD